MRLAIRFEARWLGHWIVRVTCASLVAYSNAIEQGIVWFLGTKLVLFVCYPFPSELIDSSLAGRGTDTCKL